MKKLSILIVSLLMISLTSLATESSPTSKTEKFKVYGNCGMCENRIENAAKAVDGVSSADWDKETKMIEVTFDEAKTDIHKINLAIAEAGHDTNMHRSKNETYDNLPGCCHYDRAPMEKKEMNHDRSDAHSSCKSKGMNTSGKSCCSNK